MPHSSIAQAAADHAVAPRQAHAAQMSTPPMAQGSSPGLALDPYASVAGYQSWPKQLWHSPLHRWLHEPEVPRAEAQDRKRFADDMFASWDEDESFADLWQHPRWQGALNLARYPQLTALPDHLDVQGDVIAFDHDNITALPEGIIIEGRLEMRRCKKIFSLPEELFVTADAEIHACPAFAYLPEQAYVANRCVLSDLPLLQSLPKNFEVLRSISLCRCPQFCSIEPSEEHRPGLVIRECARFSWLPRGIGIDGHLRLENNPEFISLPPGLDVLGSVHVIRCLNFSHVPRRMTLGGHLCILDCPRLVSWPTDASWCQSEHEHRHRRINVVGSGMGLLRRRALRLHADKTIRFRFFRNDAHGRAQQRDELPFELIQVRKRPATGQRDGLMCPLTLESEHHLDRAVFLGTSDNPRVYAFDLLLQWWMIGGQDPATRTFFELDELWRAPDGPGGRRYDLRPHARFRR